MACLDMYNSDQQKGHHHHCPPPMSPRISFSNDFVDSQHMKNQEHSSSSLSSSRLPPAASLDFEFSVSGYSMMSADELFCKGRFLPFKEDGDSGNQMQRTIRDELLAGDEDEVSLRPPKGSTKWKGLLGLRRNHIGSKKVDKTSTNELPVDGESRKAASLVQVQDQDQDQTCAGSKSSQELLSEDGSSCRDVEMGI